MKKNTKNKGFSPSKKIFSAAAMLAVSASMLATSTYAWFTMNKTVTVSGMQLTTKVGSNLLISADNNDANFTKTFVAQSLSGILEPVSTVDGFNYFYTVQAAADGQRLASVTTYEDLSEPGNSDTAFNSAYGTTGALGYIDYTFYLKATSTLTGGEKVSLTKCNLYKTETTGEAPNQTTTKVQVADKAWRVAMFCEPVNSTDTGCSAGTATIAATTNLKTVLGLTGADYFTDNKGVAAASGDSQLADVTNWSTAANVGPTISQGVTQYYYVTVRVWLEGEDKSCTSQTYAPLADVPYFLDLRFDLVAPSDTHAATGISSDITWDPATSPQPDLT